jgi:thiol:disulfide interchange protein/DsbC/DsbD-like thiol-disulfide interchange protein
LGRGFVLGIGLLRFIQSLVFALVFWTGASSAQPVRTANVEAQLHTARAAVAPGERFTIVLRQSIREDWHTYWVNPGDSGEPTELTWRAPEGWSVGPIQWPAPEAIPFDILVNFGYSGEVLYPIVVTAPADARVGERVTLTADAYWLVCSDICIPEEATLSLSVPIAAQGRDDLAWAARVADAVNVLPKRDPSMQAHIASGAPATLSLTLAGAEAIRNPRFFPYDRDAMRASEPQRPRVGPRGVSFSLVAGAADNLGTAPLLGVVTYEARDGADWARRAVEIEAAPGAPIADTSTRPATISPDYALAELEGAPALEEPNLDAVALIAVLGFAFLGGLILNIMPCVLPVLSVKALSFAGGAHAGAARRHGVLYLAGVVVTFLALAGILIALRGAGEALGWGFQLQAPWVTGGLALLFFAIGLNLLDVFQVAGFENAGSGLAARGGDIGAFFTGALAVVAATPCTAPFMAGAIGAAITQNAATTILIFGVMALGFAAPLTALAFAPGLQRLIPKPGPWMERAKSVLAFPMFATAVWLAWVVTEQAGATGVLALLSLATALGFALFVARWGRVWAIVGLIALAMVTAFSWRPLAGIESTRVLASEPWSAARVEQLRAEGRGVFVNFTAAWCVTCKVNEATSLARPRVAEAFARADAVYLVADWTNRDDEIASVLASHGRAGVPLYLYYPGDGGEPIVLPQILTESLLIATTEGENP